MGYQLSEGCFKTIMSGGEVPEPVVQVLSWKKMNSSGQERLRACLSDGKYMITVAMITAPVLAKVGGKGVPKFSVIKLTRYVTTVINNTSSKGDGRVLLMLDIVLVADGDEIGEPIGSPVAYSEAIAKESASVSPPAKVPKLSGMSDASRSNDTSHNRSISANGVINPITSLNPYNNKWVIKARVMNKSPIRTWANSRGEGKLFSMDLVDESGEIRLTGFKDAVDKFYDKIEVDKVYYISKCQIKTANKQFSNLKNDYEMSMVNDTIIEECADDDIGDTPQIKYNFVPIQKIVELEPGTIIDVVAVAKEATELLTFQARSTGRELKKKDVVLIDQSNTAVTLTLWGADAENFAASNNPVVVLKGAKINEFGGGKTLSTVSGTMIKVNPDLKEVYRLKQWYDSEGSSIEANSVSARTGAGATFNTPWMSFKQVFDQQLGSNSAAGDYYQVKGTVLMVKGENSCYKACPTPECNKKVVDNSNGMYRCEKCNREYESFKWRLLCSMNVGDWSGNQWVSMFSSEAEKVLGMPAQEAGDLFENNPQQYVELVEKAHFRQFVLKCRAKTEVYNDEQRLKTVAIKVDPVNYQEYNAHLINSIKQLASLQ